MNYNKTSGRVQYQNNILLIRQHVFFIHFDTYYEIKSNDDNMECQLDIDVYNLSTCIVCMLLGKRANNHKCKYVT